MVGDLSRHYPEALLQPGVRGAIHVGLETDAFSAADLLLVSNRLTWLVVVQRQRFGVQSRAWQSEDEAWC